MFSLKHDLIFAFVFGVQKNERILMALANDLLHLEGEDRIVEMTLLNPANPRMNLHEKFSVLDIKAVDGQKRRFNIEMQVAPDDDFVPRILFYHDRLFIEQLKDSGGYHELCPAISLSILDFVLFPQESELQNVFKYLNLRSHCELSSLKILHFIELPKFTIDKPRKLRTRFEKWLHILKFSELYYENPEEMPPELQREEEIVMAMKRMYQVTREEMILEAYRAREKAELDQLSRTKRAIQKAHEEGLEVGRKEGLERGLEEGRSKGLEEGRSKGLEKGREEGREEGMAAGDRMARLLIARNLLKHGMSPEQVSEAVGIPVEELPQEPE